MKYTKDMFALYEAQDALESALDKVINLEYVTVKTENLQGDIQDALEALQRIMEG